MPLVVPHELLGREPAHALYEAAFDLADIYRWIDAAACVVQDIDLEHPALASARVDDHLGASCTVSEIVEGAA